MNNKGSRSIHTTPYLPIATTVDPYFTCEHNPTTDRTITTVGNTIYDDFGDPNLKSRYSSLISDIGDAEEDLYDYGDSSADRY